MGSEIVLTEVESDADYEAWRSVRIAVLPHERCASTEELKKAINEHRLMLLAHVDGELVGSGMAQRGDTAGGMVAPRVLEAHRRQGYGGVILDRLVAHLREHGVTPVQAGCDDDASVAFALKHDFVETDREVEQIRPIGDEHAPEPLSGVEVIALSERPELWGGSYDTFGQQAMADFALHTPLEVSRERWESDWAGDPMFVALDEAGEVIGCCGLFADTDKPERAEHALTAVRRDHRGRGIAVHLKQRVLHWAAEQGLGEVYTWTQQGNAAMRTLNERLGYRPGITSVTMSRDLG